MRAAERAQFAPLHHLASRVSFAKSCKPEPTFNYRTSLFPGILKEARAINGCVVSHTEVGPRFLRNDP